MQAVNISQELISPVQHPTAEYELWAQYPAPEQV